MIPVISKPGRVDYKHEVSSMAFIRNGLLLLASPMVVNNVNPEESKLLLREASLDEHVPSQALEISPLEVLPVDIKPLGLSSANTNTAPGIGEVSSYDDWNVLWGWLIEDAASEKGILLYEVMKDLEGMSDEGEKRAIVERTVRDILLKEMNLGKKLNARSLDMISELKDYCELRGLSMEALRKWAASFNKPLIDESFFDDRIFDWRGRYGITTDWEFDLDEYKALEAEYESRIRSALASLPETYITIIAGRSSLGELLDMLNGAVYGTYMTSNNELAIRLMIKLRLLKYFGPGVCQLKNVSSEALQKLCFWRAHYSLRSWKTFCYTFDGLTDDKNQRKQYKYRIIESPRSSKYTELGFELLIKYLEEQKLFSLDMDNPQNVRRPGIDLDLHETTCTTF